MTAGTRNGPKEQDVGWKLGARSLIIWLARRTPSLVTGGIQMDLGQRGGDLVVSILLYGELEWCIRGGDCASWYSASGI